jgi:6-phosphogluconolactonase
MRFLFLCCTLFFACASSAQKYFLFIGTYTGTGSKGIYVYQFDAATGKATWLNNTDSGTVVNPSFLDIAPNQQFVYACTETRTANAGGISAFSFNKKNYKLSFINKQTSGGDNPCYVSVHKNGNWATVGNYSGGSLASFPINKDGSTQVYSQLIQHEGTGIKKQQEKAHVHATVFSPDGKYLFTPDLGIDKIMTYQFNATASQPLKPAAASFTQTTPGSGPRHFTFHPNSKWAYLIEELSGTVSSYNHKNGKLNFIQRISAHADTATGEFGSADIHISPDGKFLYASNRGKENNIAIFKIDKLTGQLTTIGYQSTIGIRPRNFCIDPSGNYLLAANQQTGNIVIFKRNKTTGLLQPTGEEINIPEPVCLKMIKMK